MYKILSITTPYIHPAQRKITVRLTVDGIQTNDQKAVYLLRGVEDKLPMVIIPITDGKEGVIKVSASALDGERALIAYNYDNPRKVAIRSINIDQDLELNIDLNDGTGGSGPSFPEGNSKVRGAVQNMDGTPAVGKNIYAYHRDSGAFLSKGVLPQDGKFDLHLPTPPTEKILLVAVDPSNEQSPPVLDYVIPEEV